MDTEIRTRSVVSFGAAFSLALAPVAFAADLTLQKVPPLSVEQAASYPENLARYHFGAQVEAAPQSRPIARLELSSNSEDRNDAEAALLCDDPTVGYSLPAGKTTLLVTLSKIENLDRISFLSSGARGSVTVAASSAKLPADSPQWHQLAQQPLSDAVQANVGPVDAKYVRLTFDITEPGRVAALGVYPTAKISDFTALRARRPAVQDKSDSFALISYSLSDVHEQARALYVSSGNDLRQANNVIDDQPGTSYAFASDDGAPTVVIDLGKVSTLRRLSAVYAPRAGKIDFYVMQALASAAAEGTPDQLRLTESTVEGLKALGSVTDEEGRGRASIDFPATSARYVMVRWTPAAQQEAPFTIAEVAAFSGASASTQFAANDSSNASFALQTSDGKTLTDGKTFIDTKDMPAEGLEAAPPGEGPPPSLPEPPGFAFIPVIPAAPPVINPTSL